jgi:hypothetical protein
MTLAVGFAAIALLICAAYLLRSKGHAGETLSRSAANPWLIGIVAFVFTSLWWALMTVVFSPNPPVSAGVAFLLGLAWAILGYGLVRYLAAGRGFTDMHRWAASFAATLGCMLPGYLSLYGWTRPDLIFRIVVNIAAFVGFLFMARSILRRSTGTAQNA